MKNGAILQYFSEILGSDVARDKIRKIKMVLDNNDLNAEDCVFITDTLGDILEARQCGIESIAVTWGYHEAERLQKGNLWQF